MVRHCADKSTHGYDMEVEDLVLNPNDLGGRNPVAGTALQMH